MNYKYIIGIDEAGRGPIAGPVSVGAVFFDNSEYKKFKRKNKILIGKDSKKLSKKKREEWFQKIQKLCIENIVIFSSNKIIDKKGIVFAINTAIKKIFLRFNKNPKDCLILLDGNLKAPKIFKNQKTIIRGDEKEIIISLASIVAKVKRDEYMKKISKKYSNYFFEKHKGYGTKLHYKMLKKYGLCVIHRKTFLTKGNIKTRPLSYSKGLAFVRNKRIFNRLKFAKNDMF